MRLLAVALSIVCLITVAKSEARCELPDAPQHGRVFQVGKNLIAGSFVIYTCDEGWRIVGSATSKCTDTGKWNSPKPRCVEFPFDSERISSTERSPTSTSTRYPTTTSVKSPTSNHVRSAISTPVESLISTPVGSSISTPVVSTGVRQQSSFVNQQPPFVPLGSNSNCTCTYINSDANLVAYANTQRLRTRDLVKDGYKIRFHCSPLGYYRLNGPRNITCRYCRTWFSSEYPKCVLPRMGDAIIRVQGTDSVEFPGGYLGVPQGSLLRLICLHYFESNRPGPFEDPDRFEGSGYQTKSEFDRSPYLPEFQLSPYQPEWHTVSKTAPDNIFIYDQVAYEHGTMIKSQVLELNNVKREHNNEYLCAVRGSRNMSIEIQAISSDVSCPTFNQEGYFTVLYDKGQSVNSSAVFSCKNSNEMIVGFPNLTCMPNGHWSADPPQCMKICPKLQETEGMRIHYSNMQETDSTANFHCQPPRMLQGVSYTRCKSDGQWVDPIPTCELSLCPLSDLYREFPGNVVIITGETMIDIVPYNFSLRLNCANNGKMNGMSDTVRCGLGGMWEIGDVSRRERQGIFTRPVRPSRYGPPTTLPYLGRQLRPSDFGGHPGPSSYGESLRIWFEKCFGNIRSSYTMGSYSRDSSIRVRTTKRSRR